MATTNSNPTPEETKEVLKRFSNYMSARRGLADATIELSLSIARRAIPIIGLTPSHAAVEDYIASFRARKGSFSHLANTISGLHRLMDFFGNPIKLQRPKKPKQVIVGVLSEAEIAITINATKDLRERTIFEILAYSGIRNKELCNLRIQDVDIAGNLLSVMRAKDGMHRVICVAPACMQTIADYLHERNGQPSDFLFVTKRRGNQLAPQDLRKMVRIVASKAKIDKRVHPHLFRHSLATNMLHRGAGLFTIKEQLGHESIGTTLLYIHCSQEKLREDYRAFVPSYT